MVLDVDLEFEKYCIVDGSAKTVLPSPLHHPKAEKRNAEVRPICGDDLWSFTKDFSEINPHRFWSSSCRSIPTRTSGLQNNEVVRRGSVYQNSTKVRKIKKTLAVAERRKIELSQRSATASSIGVVDSLCSSDEDSSQFEEKRSSLMLRSQDFLELSCHQRGVKSNDSLEIPLGLECRVNLSAGSERSNVDLKNRCEKVVGSLYECGGLGESDTAYALYRSLSAKLALSNSPAQSESDFLGASSPKSWSSLFRKLLDPFVKSKSQKSPLAVGTEDGHATLSVLGGISRNKTFRKSLLQDFSSTTEIKKCDSQLIQKEFHNSPGPCSPAHLHGHLKLENKHGVPFFEFSVQSPEEVFVAKTWKVDNALNWIYTFHSSQNRRKSGATGWGLRGSNKESSMVGQMQVSCYLCTELKDAGAFDDSVVTEFVLYDIAHARKIISAQDCANCSPDIDKYPRNLNNSCGSSCKVDEISDKVKPKLTAKHTSDSTHNHIDLSTPYPWPTTILNPNLEIAAIVVQVPFEKRESLKCNVVDMNSSDHPLPIKPILSEVDGRKKGVSGCPARVNVVTPSGSHSLPTAESCGPSPILDRWRMGGGCDCSGWDVACPLAVFCNPDIQSADGCPVLVKNWHLELSLQGAKETAPSLTMKAIEEGQYAVDFHAQLSTLQAFSICVAILHSTEATAALEKERERELLACSSLRVFVEEEVKYSFEALTEEAKKKGNKKTEELPTTFVLNPPFSPIARA